MAYKTKSPGPTRQSQAGLNRRKHAEKCMQVNAAPLHRQTRHTGRRSPGSAGPSQEHTHHFQPGGPQWSPRQSPSNPAAPPTSQATEAQARTTRSRVHGSARPSGEQSPRRTAALQEPNMQPQTRPGTPPNSPSQSGSDPSKADQGEGQAQTRTSQSGTHLPTQRNPPAKVPRQ